MPPTPSIAPAVRVVIDECWRCHKICLDTMRLTLAGGGTEPVPEIGVTLLDCADLCRTAADSLTRGSPHAGIACAACAAICRLGAEECRAAGDARLAGAAEACDRCATACGSVFG